MLRRKATSVPRQYLLSVSSSYAMNSARANGGVNNLSGAQTVFAQLLDQGGAADAQQSRGAGNGAVRFLQRLAYQADLDGRHMVLQIDAALRQRRLEHFIHDGVGFAFGFALGFRVDSCLRWRECRLERLGPRVDAHFVAEPADAGRIAIAIG